MSTPLPLPESVADKPDWARRLWGFLTRAGYTSEAAREITFYAIRWGTVQCSLVEPEDLDQAEAIVPLSADWSRPLWGQLVYTLTPFPTGVDPR